MATIDLDTLTLDKGSHRTPEEGACLLEATALFAGEPFDDHPACVSRVLAEFGISINDHFGDERRQELKRFIPLLPGTAGDGQDEARGYLALDWLIRTYTPAFLDLRPELADVAAELRELPRIVDLASARSAAPVVRAVRDKSSAAVTVTATVTGTAVYAARYDAVYAAMYAARYAAVDAAMYAAVGADGYAADAAGYAADAAAAAAAGDALQPTVDRLQNSAIELFARMIDPARTGWTSNQTGAGQ